MRSFDVFFDLRLNKRLSKNRGAGDLKRPRAQYDAILMGRYRLVGNTLTYRKRYVRLPENWCWMMDFASFAKCMIGLLLEICYCLFWYLRHRWTDASVFDIWRKLHFTPRIVNAANLTTLPEMLLGGVTKAPFVNFSESFLRKLNFPLLQKYLLNYFNHIHISRVAAAALRRHL